MMDPLQNLDMEKKMGFGMKDVDDFLERAKDVEQKINDIKSGKISVEQLEREREQEEREKAEAAAAKAKRLADIERRRVEREAKEKVEEHARWWEGADVLYPIEEQRELASMIPGAQLHEIDTEEGHDGFLLEDEQIDGLIRNFLHEPPTVRARL